MKLVQSSVRQCLDSPVSGVLNSHKFTTATIMININSEIVSTRSAISPRANAFAITDFYNGLSKSRPIIYMKPKLAAVSNTHLHRTVYGN